MSLGRRAAAGGQQLQGDVADAKPAGKTAAKEELTPPRRSVLRPTKREPEGFPLFFRVRRPSPAQRSYQFAFKPIGCRLCLAVLQHGLRLVCAVRMESDLVSSDRNGADRAEGNAGAATGTSVRVQFGQGGASDPGRKANRPGIAEIAADAAFDALPRQAGRSDLRFQPPGRDIGLAQEGRRPAGLGAGAAKRCIRRGGNPPSGSRLIPPPGWPGAGRQAVATTRAALGESASLPAQGQRRGSWCFARAGSRDGWDVDHRRLLSLAVLSMLVLSMVSISDPGSTMGRSFFNKPTASQDARLHGGSTGQEQGVGLGIELGAWSTSWRGLPWRPVSLPWRAPRRSRQSPASWATSFSALP